MRQQSDVAKRYLNLRDTLKELEINVYIENISKFKEKIKEFEESYISIKDNIDSDNKKLEDITLLNQKKLALLKELETKLDNSRQEFYNLENSLERCNSEIKLNDEKKSNLSSNMERLEGEIEEIDEKLESITKEEVTRNEKMKYLNERLADYNGKLEEADKKLQSVLATLNEHERYIENMKSSIMDKLDLQSDKKTQINNVKNHIEVINKRKLSIDDETMQLMLEKDREGMRKEDLSDSISKTKELLKGAKSRLESLNIKKVELNQTLEVERKKQNTVKSDIQLDRKSVV